MENKREKSTCVFRITGGNNQIVPNATEVVQNFYGDQFGEAALKGSQPEASKDVSKHALCFGQTHGAAPTATVGADPRVRPAIKRTFDTPPSDGEAPEEEEPDSLRLAEGELRIYYPDDVLLKAFIVRIGSCRDAADLANLVVGDMMEHTILKGDIAVKSHFIEALLMFVHFTKGSSVSNIRQRIRKQVADMPKGGKDR